MTTTPVRRDAAEPGRVPATDLLPDAEPAARPPGPQPSGDQPGGPRAVQPPDAAPAPHHSAVHGAGTVRPDHAPGGLSPARSGPGAGPSPGSGGADRHPAGLPAPPRTVRYAALGDSLTEGIGDPVAGGRRGWAALLAAGLAPAGADLLNTARSGARAADVAREQLDLARSHRPHLASVLVGVNDTLRASYDIEQVAESLDTVLRTLHRDGVRTLTACLPDPGRMLGLPLLLARPLARRMRAVNTVVHALSHRYDAIHLHTAELPGLDDRTAWSVDRLHPSERGHRLLARGFHRLLADAGIAHGAPPGARPEQPAPGPAEQLWWIATHGTRWVAARCTDLLPDLLKLAAEEGRHQLAGTVRLLDLRTEHATDAALATLARMGG